MNSDEILSSGDELVKIKIPVVYDMAEKATEMIWQDMSPDLVVHCGVSHIATGIVLEKRAVTNLERYCANDQNGSCPSNGATNLANKCSKLTYICSGIDTEDICQKVNKSKSLPLLALASEKAGEYLCEFIYRCSLLHNKARTLFIHVPEVNDNVTIEDIARCLTQILKALVEQIVKI